METSYFVEEYVATRREKYHLEMILADTNQNDLLFVTIRQHFILASSRHLRNTIIQAFALKLG